MLLDQLGLENCSLKYLRFKCADSDQTKDFYQTLGMVFDGNVSFGDKCVCMKFTYASKKQDQVFLLFETKKKGVQTPETEVSELKRDYMIIYIHFLNRVIKRLSAKKFRVLMNHNYMEMQYAVLIDPNGIEVRLIELPESHYTDKSNWFGRIGYFVCQVSDCEDAANFFESIFSKEVSGKLNQELPTNAAIEGLKSIHLQTKSFSKNTSRRFSLRDGFRLVDTDSIVTGLTHVNYRWLSSGSREQSTCICFVDQLHGHSWQTKLEQKVLIKDTRLISLGISVVCPLDFARKQTTKLSLQLGRPCSFPPERSIFASGFGYIAFMQTDFCNVELISPIDVTGKTKKKKLPKKEKIILMLQLNQKFRQSFSDGNIQRFLEEDKEKRRNSI